MASFTVTSEPKAGETAPTHVIFVEDAEPGLQWKLIDLAKESPLEIKHAGKGLRAFTRDDKLLAVVTAKLVELGYTKEEPTPQVQA